MYTPTTPGDIYLTYDSTALWIYDQKFAHISWVLSMPAAHSGSFDEFFYHSTCASNQKTRQMKAEYFSLILHCHDLTSFF